MIDPSGAVRVMVATEPMDFRKAAERLSALVQEELGSDPSRRERADRIKLVFWDGAGLCRVAKRPPASPSARPMGLGDHPPEAPTSPGATRGA